MDSGSSYCEGAEGVDDDSGEEDCCDWDCISFIQLLRGARRAVEQIGRGEMVSRCSKALEPTSRLTGHAELELLWVSAPHLGHELVNFADGIGLLERRRLVGEVTMESDAGCRLD
jgi:hypothetical protein